MLYERAEISVKQDMEQEVSAIMRERGVPHLTGALGVYSVQFGQGVENSGKFMLLVAWATQDAHAAFTKSSTFPGFQRLFALCAVSGSMEHFDLQ